MDADRTLDQLRELLRGRKDVRFALVFGPRARGRSRSASDLDVAVHAPDVEAFAREVAVWASGRPV